MFDDADYQRAAARLEVPVPHIKAMAAVESSGETSWTVNGSQVVPVRFEAHVFGKLTGYRYNTSDPALSSYTWRPELAAKTRAGAWEQVLRARALDRDAANCATSWGAYQVMGFNWNRLDFPSVQSFIDCITADGDDGQMEVFIRFIQADPTLHRALKVGDWATVERLYNGGGFGGAYADKLRAAVTVYGGDAPAPRVLIQGTSGPDVAALQAALGVTADGSFGPVTAAAVRAFQAKNGLVVDAVVGAMTRRALGI